MFTTVFYPCKVLITAGSLIQIGEVLWIGGQPIKTKTYKVMRWYKSRILLIIVYIYTYFYLDV